MNAIANKSLVATALVALLGAASLAFMEVEPTVPAQEVLKFERVVIEGKQARAEQAVGIVVLPRVVIEGRRGDAVQLANAAMAAKAANCSTTALC